jgi:hypothetical protein
MALKSAALLMWTVGDLGAIYAQHPESHTHAAGLDTLKPSMPALLLLIP